MLVCVFLFIDLFQTNIKFVVVILVHDFFSGMDWHLVGGDEDQLKIEAFVPGDPFTSLVKSFRNMDKSIEKMRTTASNEEWKAYVDVCFTPMVLKETLKRNKKHVCLGEYFTPYDEAFALVVVENNIEAWIAEALNWGVKKREMEDLKKYNSKSTSNTNGTPMKRKWSVKGKKRFNEILDEIEAQREKEESKQKEEWLKDIWRGGDGEGTGIVFVNNGEGDEMDDSDNDDDFVPRNGFMMSV